MKFMLTFTLQPATRNEAIARCMKTAKGANLLGRWRTDTRSARDAPNQRPSFGFLAVFIMAHWLALKHCTIDAYRFGHVAPQRTAFPLFNGRLQPTLGTH